MRRNKKVKTVRNSDVPRLLQANGDAVGLWFGLLKKILNPILEILNGGLVGL